MENQLSPFQVYLLDGSGSAREASKEVLENCIAGDGSVVWIHLDYSQDSVAEWLHSLSWLDPIIKDNLLDEDTRPRCIHFNESLFLSLRGVNQNPSSDPEDMVALRLWITDKYVISSNRRPLHAITDIQASFRKTKGPKSTSDFLRVLLKEVSHQAELVVNLLDDTVDQIEEDIILENYTVDKSQLSVVRRRALRLRRYLAPQKEALNQLLDDTPKWVSKKDKLYFKETLNALKRNLEILDFTRERTIVIHEELQGRMSETLNQRMYIISVVAAIFLPLGFLTGLLGINVGGVPGGQSEHGFWIICSLILLAFLCLLSYLKHTKWI